MNALSKFELSTATPVDPNHFSFGFPRTPVPSPGLLDLRVKQSGTISTVILMHPDADHTVFIDTSSLLTPNILRVPHHGGVYITTRDYQHTVPTLHTCAAVNFPTVQRDFCTYAVVGTGTTSSLLTAFLDETHNNPVLEALASYDTFEKPNWDGHDAQPITRETLDYALRIVRLLPDILGAPDIAPSADGSIGLEWVPDHGPLTKLFMDIGPGVQWHAYWRRENGYIGRVSGAEIRPHTRTILHNLFTELSM